MSDDLLRSAHAEEQRLLNELQRLPLYRKLEAVRSLISTYADTNSSVVPLVAKPTVTPTHRKGSRAFRVSEAAQAYLQRVHHRAQSAEILSVLQGDGFEFTTEKPQAELSSILSHSELFDNIRGQGYGLVEWAQKGAEPSIANIPQPQHESEPGSQDTAAVFRHRPRLPSELLEAPDLPSTNEQKGFAEG